MSPSSAMSLTARCHGEAIGGDRKLPLVIACGRTMMAPVGDRC
jgi:hypothetical protein